jgi:hypothetical protein
MYHKVEGGTLEIIQGIECWIPPVGYGVDRLTGELVYIGVHSRSPKKAEQKWERLELPADYIKKRAKEEARQKSDPEYFDPDLEAIREKHWKYRRCGHWFMKKGKPVYITGTHWLYLNWGATNVGKMKYRETNRKIFYCLRSIEDDPRAAGLVYVSRRRGGKTYMAAIWMFDRLSLAIDKIGGIQSKTDTDAYSVFSKIVHYFVNMPHFFRPVYDTSGGIRPKKALKFFKTNKRGKGAEEILEGEELRSEINYGSSKSFYYDGQALYCYILDEFGKPQENDTWETWKVVQYTMDQDGVWVGKSFVTSTVEDLDVTGQAPKEIWKNSDQNNRDANGRTVSGLYRIFFGAHEDTILPDDKEGQEYGDPDVQKNIDYYNEKRKSKAHSTRDLSSEIRKNPFTIEEAFRIDGDNCLYDAFKLNERLDRLAWKDNITTRGNFVWENGVRDSKVIFEPCDNGRWEVVKLLPDGESNKFYKRGDLFYPNNSMSFVMGVDPIDHSVTEDGRRSNGAGIVLQKYNEAKTDDIYNYAFVAYYCHRPESVQIFYEDMIKMAAYYGCHLLFENQKIGLMHYFNDRGYGNFLMWLPDRLQPGVAASPKTHQHMVELTEDYINKQHERIYFKSLITDWLEFRMDKTTIYDIAMAAGYALIADQVKVQRKDSTEVREVSEYFKAHKV